MERRCLSPGSTTSCSSEDAPLTAVKNETVEDNVCTYREVACEFCDKVVFNLYDILVHNARHIIIPLQNQTFYQCNKCLFHFTSQEELNFHSATKHGVTNYILQKRNITGTWKENSVERHSSKEILVQSSKDLELSKRPAKEKVTNRHLSDTTVSKVDIDITKKYVKDSVTSHHSSKDVLKYSQDIDITTSAGKYVRTRLPDILESVIKSKTTASFGDGANGRTELDRNLECLVEKQPLIRCDDTVTELLKEAQGRNKKKKGGPKSKRNAADDRRKTVHSVQQNSCFKRQNNGMITEPYTRDTRKNHNNDETTPYSGLKNRIVFENDIDLDDIGDSLDDANSYPNETGNFLEEREIQILDLCSDGDNGRDCFILPDDGCMNRILVTDDSYILPDDGPQLPMLPMPSETQPVFGRMLLGSKAIAQGEVSSPPSFKSVHYDTLMAPGLYSCLRCRKKFPTKFEVIVHEKSHMKIRTRFFTAHCNNCPVCDRYITGNHWSLKRHISQRHPGIPNDRTYSRSTCGKCGLHYRSYKQHERNYHKLYVCYICGLRFETEAERCEHSERNECSETFKSDTVKRSESQDRADAEEMEVVTLKVCELCSLFLKDKGPTRYLVCGSENKAGKRQKCSRCSKKFFEVKIVKRFQRKRKRSELKKKVSLNENRLKIMQQRLKMFNKLSQC